MNDVATPPALDEGEAYAEVNGVRLCYQTFGRSDAPAMLLIHGLGAQMILWEDRFCDLIAERGYFVVRFDNRDIGKSSRVAAPPINVMELMRTRKPGERLVAPYLLADMASDAVGLLDHLRIASAHIVGVSMGGMIAQEMAIGWPSRVSSLTSIMSTTGDARLPPPTPEAAAILMSPPARNADEYVASYLRSARVIRGPDYPPDVARETALALRCAARGLSPDGGQRQLLAIIASGNRKATLPSIMAPTLVIHGDADPLIPLAAGEATARAIPGARLSVIEGMGHALPEALWPRIVGDIASIAM
jgi:pimeloyl-ACP methyl ester carboxylesterase